MEQEDSKKERQNPPEVSCKPQSSKNDGGEMGEENPPEGFKKPECSAKNTFRSLKVKSKIVKKFQTGKLTKKNVGAKQRKNKKLLGNKESCSNGEENGKKQILENNQEKRTTDEKPKEKGQQAEKNNEDNQNRSTGDKLLNGKRLKSHHVPKNKEKIIESDKSQQKQKKKEKHQVSNKGERSIRNRYKLERMEKSEFNEKKKEMLGGFIFMCNAKTKPDCFRYRVMGVSKGKKDVVLGVKPGLKLFLYDFDLKLMYGIYKASSSGGLKLEPRAFGGSFPVQVRFNIDKDCFPLPESIFKRAIKDNYNEKQKFKTELTVRQVRKLTQLFKPVGIHSSLQPVRTPPKAIIQKREEPDGVSGLWSHSQRERPARDHYVKSHVSSYNVLSHERDRRMERREEIPYERDYRVERREEIPYERDRRIERREEIPYERDRQIELREEIPQKLFLTEKDYRAYGLRGDRRNMTPPSHFNSVLEPCKRGYEREHVHGQDPIYRDNVPLQAVSLGMDPLYLNESQVYSNTRRNDYTMDTKHAYHYSASLRDPYLPTLSREEISSSSYLRGGRTLIEADDMQRRESVQERLYSTYAADALSDYNQMQHYHEARREATPVPVSSRYSFAGPSYSFR